MQNEPSANRYQAEDRVLFYAPEPVSRFGTVRRIVGHTVGTEVARIGIVQMVRLCSRPLLPLRHCARIPILFMSLRVMARGKACDIGHREDGFAAYAAWRR